MSRLQLLTMLWSTCSGQLLQILESSPWIHSVWFSFRSFACSKEFFHLPLTQDQTVSMGLK